MTAARINSIQSLGAVDGPGLRFVIFMQGCPLRCGCCHNPETQSLEGGTEYSAEEIFSKAVRYKEYFGKNGGITASGGEPLVWSEFLYELFYLCKSEGINTCLDTSGAILDERAKKLLSVTDRVLLDIKYTSDELYRSYVGCELSAVLNFLAYLDEKAIPTTLRQVVIPTKNLYSENFKELERIAKGASCVDKVELLPFKKLCSMKYEKLGREFLFADIPEPSGEDMKLCSELIKLN